MERPTAELQVTPALVATVSETAMALSISIRHLTQQKITSEFFDLFGVTF